MFSKNESVYFIHLSDGVLQEGKFLEYDQSDKGGIWIRLKGQSANKFIFSDDVNRLIYKSREEAFHALEQYRLDFKNKLQDPNELIGYIFKKLISVDGKLYAEVVKEVLQEKVKND
ncbi:MAG: hypothetical protein N2645_13545 [Clostridia bacterium]|nr:hypothetical protein [Clostridia bacterium]